MTDAARSGDGPRFPRAGGEGVRPPLHWAVAVPAIAAVYFAAAKLGLSLALVAEQVSAVWPPTGIALAAVLVLGRWVWPGIALGAFLANATTNEPLATAGGIAVGNTLEALVGAWLLQRLVGSDGGLARLKDALGLIVLGAGLSTTVSATIGVASLCLGGVQPWSAYGTLWSEWWLGDAMGDLVMAPVLLVWSTSRPDWSRRRAVEALGLLLILTATSLVVFTGRVATGVGDSLLAYTIFPVVIWAALRLGQHGTTAATLIASSLAIWGTWRGLGPFSAGPVHERLLLLQAFMGAVAGTALLLSAALAERRRGVQRLATLHTVTRILSQSATLADATPRIIRAICESLAWQVGAIWHVDRDAQVLRCVEVWQARPARFVEFEALTRQRTFEPGTGLPGRVWASGRPAWIQDVVRDRNFPRAPVAAREGLHGAFGFPIRLGDEVLGVIEFFSSEIRRPDDDLLRMMATVGGQIGQFIERKRGEGALRQSEARKAAVLEAALDAIITMDHEGRIVEFNPAAEQVFGYPRAEAIGKPMDELIVPPSLRERHRQGLAQYLAAGEASMIGKRLELPAVRADGTEFRAEVAIIRIPVPGNPLFTGYIRDVTERRRGAEALRDSEERSRSVVDHVVDGIITIDDRGTVTSFNPAAERLFGYQASEVVGQNVRLLMPEPYHSEHDGYIDSYLRTGRAKIIGTGREVVGRRKDGSVFPMELAVSTFRQRERRFFTGIVRDVTERKRADERIAELNHALRHRVEELQTLLDVLPVGIFIAQDAACTNITVNTAGAAMLRVPQGANASKTGADVARLQFRVLKDGVEVAGEDLPMQRAARTGVPIMAEELQVAHQDGTVITLYEYALPLFDESGAVRGCLGAFVDITERKQAEEALREADRRKDQFLATLAHELRNPLAPIRNGLEIMRQVGLGDDRLRQVRDMLERQVLHMTRLVDDLLDVSRITHGQVRLQRAQVDLAEVVARAVEASRPSIEARRQELTLSLPPEPLRLLADPVRLAQVFGNLLNNAAKFSTDGGRIWLTAARVGAEVEVRVRDMGIGIAPDALGHVFELFTRANRSPEHPDTGLGIGLTLVRTLVEMHGGSVQALSEGHGRGSEFIVRLPLWPEAPAREPVRAAPGKPPAPAVPYRILVVDDNLDAVESLGLLLKLHGHDVRTAHDGPSALQAAQQYRPDVVLLDISLPGMDGHEVARRILALPALETTLLVAMSGYGREEDKRRSREAGFAAHLVKPVDPDILSALLARRGPVRSR